MKPAVTILTANFFVASAIILSSCNDDDQRSYVEYYHPQPSVIFASNPGTLKYNPKHGQPGHRCDLPDGAPLPTTSAVSSEAASRLANFAASNPKQGQTSGLNLAPSAPGAPASAGPLNPAHGQPGHRCDIAVGAPLSSVPAKSTIPPASSAGLNPAHGKPGHRCDIAVGAPLNSAPAKNAAAANNAISNPVSSNSTTTSSLKVNPAHGQPGHRCDIAVGAPLNSPKPGSATGSATGTTVPLPPVITNSAVKTDTSRGPIVTTDSSGKSVRLNPAHGQPGHDCSIAVGKPLKQ